MSGIKNSLAKTTSNGTMYGAQRYASENSRCGGESRLAPGYLILELQEIVIVLLERFAHGV